MSNRIAALRNLQRKGIFVREPKRPDEPGRRGRQGIAVVNVVDVAESLAEKGARVWFAPGRKTAPSDLRRLAERGIWVPGAPCGMETWLRQAKELGRAPPFAAIVAAGVEDSRFHPNYWLHPDEVGPRAVASRLGPAGMILFDAEGPAADRDWLWNEGLRVRPRPWAPVEGDGGSSTLAPHFDVERTVVDGIEFVLAVRRVTAGTPAVRGSRA
jgi:hypothetical protein